MSSQWLLFLGIRVAVAGVFRSYKDTFIWCDLFDDDFILPLAGSGEYVLKAMALFDASQDEGPECEELPPVSIRSSRLSSPGKSNPRRSTRPEHVHVESDVSMAIKKSLLLIGTTDLSAENSAMGLNNQIMSNLSRSQRAPEVCSLEHSDVTSNGTYPSVEDVAESKKANASSQTAHGLERGACKLRRDDVSTSPTFPSQKHANQEKQCNVGSQTAQRETWAQQKDVTTEASMSKKDEMSSLSPTPVRTRDSSEVSARRRTWEKEVDKSTTCTQFVYHKSVGSDGEQPSSVLEESGSNSCLAGADDPFLYGVLRKATRLGSSFRPRLCRGVDVVDSTRTKTKMHSRSQSKDEGKSVMQASSFVEGPGWKNGDSLADVSEKKSYHSCYTSAEKPLKEFKTLSEHFDTKERTNSNSPVDKLISEPHSVDEAATVAQAEDSSRPPSAAAAAAAAAAAMATDSSQGIDDPPRPESRPFGNEALDASYRKTMEVLAKLPSSRGACRVHAGEGQKNTRSESKGNKQEVKLDPKCSSKVSTPSSNSQQAAPNPRAEHDDILLRSCSIHCMDGSPVAKTAEERPRAVTTSKHRRPAVKKASLASFEASTVRNSCRAKSNVKIPDEKATKTPRNVSKETTSKLQLNIVGDTTKNQLPESFTSDSRALRSGNKQGLKMATQAATKVEVAAAAAAAAAEATPRLNSKEGAKGWPFEQPVRPRDFKSREDRPLTPGLTNMDWEKTLEEACIHGEPPTNLVLHECSQCGRTFKQESLQVHVRGCGAVNKPKSSLATQRRVSL